MRTAQNPDLQQLLQMWRAGRVSLLAVVLNYVLSSVAAKLGAGVHSRSAFRSRCSRMCRSCSLRIVYGSLPSAAMRAHGSLCMRSAYTHRSHAADTLLRGTVLRGKCACLEQHAVNAACGSQTWERRCVSRWWKRRR